MQARWPVRVRRIAPYIALLSLLGCGGGDTREGGKAEPVAAQTEAFPSITNNAMTPVITTGEQTTALSNVAAPPKNDLPLGANMQTRKDFTDPPLPVELMDDGGLKPLPARPKPGEQ